MQDSELEVCSPLDHLGLLTPTIVAAPSGKPDRNEEYEMFRRVYRRVYACASPR